MTHKWNYRTFPKNQRKIKYLCMFLVIEYNLLLSIYLLFIGFCIGHKLNLLFGLTPFEEILICSIYEFWSLNFFSTPQILNLLKWETIIWSRGHVTSFLEFSQMQNDLIGIFTPRRTIWRHNNRAKLKSDRNLENRIQLNSKITPDGGLPTKLSPCLNYFTISL